MNHLKPIQYTFILTICVCIFLYFSLIIGANYDSPPELLKTMGVTEGDYPKDYCVLDHVNIYSYNNNDNDRKLHDILVRNFPVGMKNIDVENALKYQGFAIAQSCKNNRNIYVATNKKEHIGLVISYRAKIYWLVSDDNRLIKIWGFVSMGAP